MTLFERGPKIRSLRGTTRLVPVLAAGVMAGVMAGAETADAPGLSAAPGTAAAAPSLTPLPPPSLNFYGSPGLVDMPSAEMLPDGQFTTGMAYFGSQGRFTLTFQATPWLSASFRYAGIQNLNLYGYEDYYDRSFDVRLRLLKERPRFPEITLGLQDFAGTGLFSSEYLVATKNFRTPSFGSLTAPGNLKLTAGLGWGRMGSNGSIGSTGTRPAYDPDSTGGKPSYDQWFRGDFAPFAGIEWLPTEKLGLKVEYSSDAYLTETELSDVFERDSRFNFGLEYQVSRSTRLGAYYLYGSEIGVSAQIQLNPKHPPRPMVIPAPAPIRPRPSRAADPEAWTTDWANSQEVPLQARDVLTRMLREEGLVLESLTIDATTAELRFRNLQYLSFANAVGRAARTMAQILPASVETFRLIPLSGGMAVSATTIRRSDLEALEFAGDSTAQLLARAQFSGAPPISDAALENPDLYPDFSWSLAPYFTPAYFDPDSPIRLDFGVALRGTLRPAPGWILSGSLRYRLAGNLADGRPSDSVLPRVRSDAVLYAQEDASLNNLFAAYQWQVSPDIYARVTAGYLETMFGGISGEVLWKPVTSRLGLGVEANYVRQRDFDDLLSFQDYEVATGHVSAYYDFGGGFEGQLDVGRYLAGDVGATIGIDRVFDNGWSVGAWATFTDVSSEDFGEGSFDKGIRFTIPVGWLLGKPNRQTFGTAIRPVQRDGGQKLSVPGRLYPQLRAADGLRLSGQWARAWE